MLPFRPARGKPAPGAPFREVKLPLLPRRAVWIFALMIAVGAGLLALVYLIPGKPPAGQRALKHLRGGSLAALTERFDAASDSTRLLVLLSPT